MVMLLIVVVVFLVMIAGMLLAFVFSRADRAVNNMRTEMVLEERSYNPGITLGHRIKVQADYEDQLLQARREAAKRAAATPRGANSRIGRDGQSTLKPASKNLQNDPQTAVRIAQFHGWDGARSGITAAGAPAAVAAPVAAAAVAAPAPAAAVGVQPPQLIPITNSMTPEEIRKARIANSKAEAAYNKALKAAAAGGAVTAPAAAMATVAAPVGASAAPAPVAVGIEPPTLIPITDGMSPEEIRKARVANAKAEAAYNKALKAAGASAGGVVEAAPAVASPVAAAPVAAAAPAAVGVEPPRLIEITDSMSPEEIRKARVANAKAEAAYNKALKAAGVTPGVAATAAVAPEPAAEPAAVAPAAVPAVAPTTVAGIDPPRLIEITDGMSPEEVRRARVENAKLTAAYNKALKAAGIDPASLK